MDSKKNVFAKLRDKTKPLFNVKMGRKGKKTPLKYRRSISVPDLLSTQSMSSFLDPSGESSSTGPFARSNVFVSDDTKCETSSLTDSLTATDTTSAKGTDSCTAPGTPLSKSALGQYNATDLSLDQASIPNTPSSARHLDKYTAPYIPAKVVDSPLLSATPPTIIYPASERPAFMNAPGTKESSEKQTEEKERNTTWYIEDSESACSTPSEERSFSYWPQDHDLAGLDPVSPRFTEMFIIGSAEDTNEVSNESNDYDTNFSPKEIKSSGVSSEGQATAAGQKTHYLLTINLKEGRNLAIKDRCGTSDPYVKFRIDGKTVYKSKVVYKNLNPAWNECFSILVRDLEQNVYVKVYDRDLRSRDFMGSSLIPLSTLDLDKTSEMILRLKDPGSLEEDMGVIILDACVSICEGPTKRNKWPLKRKGSFNKGQLRAAAMQKSQLWCGVYTVVLVEGQDMPDGGQGDLFVRFKLGEQRFQNLCIKTNPQWRERFEFNRFDDGQTDVLLVELYCKKGRKCEECWGAVELDLSQLPANTTQTYNVIIGKGRLVFLVTQKPCSGVSISDLSSTTVDNPYTYENTLQKYSLKNTLDNLHDVGYLQVKVLRATDLSSTDLNGKSDPFCVLELGNSKLQTQTIYKTINPEWRTAFTFPIKDIHDVLMLTVFGEDGDKAPDFLGKVSIPLFSVSNGQQITSLLKKYNLEDLSKGSITLEMNVFYNPVRAAIRTFHPKETKLEEDNAKFNKRLLLARNIYRVRRISMAILYTLQYIKSCFQWESTQRSIIAFLVFVLTVWHFELFMLPLFLLLLIGWNYFHITPGVGSHSQDLESISAAEDEDEDEKESEKRGLMEKIYMVQEIVLTVQSVLDEIASFGERVKNTFNWSVPFLSILACCILFIAASALYFIPLRYIVLLWGVNKFTKKLRSPHAIENNELLDFLRRVPSDVQKVQYSELRVPGIQSAQKKKR